MLTELRDRIGAELGRLSSATPPEMTNGAGSRPRRRRDPAVGRAQLLDQLLTALPEVEATMLPARGAGFGSTVVLHDLDTGQEVTYQLLVGDFIDIDADQVSLASPIGHALLGRSEGDEIEVSTPRGTRRFRVTRIRTLQDLLGIAGTTSSSPM